MAILLIFLKQSVGCLYKMAVKKLFVEKKKYEKCRVYQLLFIPKSLTYRKVLKANSTPLFTNFVYGLPKQERTTTSWDILCIK